MSESHVAILPGVQQFLDRQHGLWIEGVRRHPIAKSV